MGNSNGAVQTVIQLGDWSQDTAVCLSFVTMTHASRITTGKREMDKSPTSLPMLLLSNVLFASTYLGNSKVPDKYCITSGHHIYVQYTYLVLKSNMPALFPGKYWNSCPLHAGWPGLCKLCTTASRSISAGRPGFWHGADEVHPRWKEHERVIPTRFQPSLQTQRTKEWAQDA